MKTYFGPPLETALQGVYNTFDNNVSLNREDGKVEFSIAFDSLCLGVDFMLLHNSTKEEILVVSVLQRVAIEPWKGIFDFFDDLDLNLEPFFEGYYARRGALELYDDGTQEGKALVPGYEERISYAALDNEELQEETHLALIAAVRSMALIAPVMGHLYEKRTVPSTHERLRLLGYAFGVMEVVGFSTDMPNRAVRLPARLFGGASSLATQ